MMPRQKLKSTVSPAPQGSRMSLRNISITLKGFISNKVYADYSKRNGSDSSSHKDHGCILFVWMNEKKLQKANGMPIRPCKNSVQFTHGRRGQHRSHQPFPSDHMTELASPASLAMGWIMYWSSGHQEMKHTIAEAGPLKTSSTSLHIYQGTADNTTRWRYLNATWSGEPQLHCLPTGTVHGDVRSCG